MNEKFAHSPFYKDLFHKFDLQLIEGCKRTKERIFDYMDKLERKLEVCEKSLSETTKKKNETRNEEETAENFVKREMKNKIFISKWTSCFRSETSCDHESDPLTHTFAQFSLNLCLCYGDVSAANLIKSKAHQHLASFIAFNSEIVQGPALMAIRHISILDELKPLIVLAGALSTLCRILAESRSLPVLLETCKLCASLAMCTDNKIHIVTSGCLHGILDLIIGTQRETNDSIQAAALSAIVNITSGSDSNRTLTVELNGLRPILEAISSSQSSESVCSGVMALSNITFNDGFSADKVVSMGGHVSALVVLQTCDVSCDHHLISACLVLLANLCCNESSQNILGATEGLCEAVLKTCSTTREPLVAAKAANLLCALAWQSAVNKATIASRGACAVLVGCLIQRSHELEQDRDRSDPFGYREEDILLCIDKASSALASLLLHLPTHEGMHGIAGLEAVVSICKVSRNGRVLRALAQVISAMVPSPQYRKQCHDEAYMLPIERINTVPVLKKIRIVGFGDYPVVPTWLERSIKCLSLTDEALLLEPVWIPREFSDRLDFSSEQTVVAVPDMEVCSKEY